MLRNRLTSALLLAGVVASSLLVSNARALPSVRTPCDDMDPSVCMFPFPNDYFTKPDATTPTGRRVDLLPVETPRNAASKPIDPTEWNRNDGFSPGSALLTFVPGLDLHQTWGTTALSTGGPNDPADQIADIGRYTAANAPILIIDTTTGERWPFWSELDLNSATPADSRTLIIRPATNFLEGHRYAVALRNMRNAAGAVIPAGPAFAAQRDHLVTTARTPEIDSVIASIKNAETARGITFDRSQLFLAWRFTVASERNLSERALHIRDDAFAQLGDTNLGDQIIQGAPPKFTITTVTETSGSSKLRQVDGTITVPNYLDGQPIPPIEKDPATGLPVQWTAGRRLLYGTDGKPMQNPAIPTFNMPFSCVIPSPATAGNPAHPMLYGHGLFGDRSEATRGSPERDRERNFMPCAVSWMGMAGYDVANALAIFADPSNMPTLADRAQQGFVNFLYLGRALAHPNGLATNAAFQDAQKKPLIRTGELFYDGNSQGGIMGGALTALSPDFTRATLGVTATNYSTLLNRSVDWEGPLADPARPGLPSYSSFLYTSFPNKLEQQLVMGMLQMLWDRAEGNGYAQHMTTDPLPNTPPHQVLMHVALGDFQVTNVAAEVEARTVGARVMDTALAPGRHWTADGSFFGLQSMPRAGDGTIAPWHGSAFVYFDSGNLRAPNANIPPSTEGGDPHGDPRQDPRGGDQKAHFYLTGDVIDVFSGGPYLLCRPDKKADIPRVPRQFTTDWCV